MLNRVTFVLVTAFFITMNVLLWRSEFGGHHQFGGSVPAELVWQKVLTAPDNSFLTIRHRGKKLGLVTWSPSVGQDRSKLLSEDNPPEGMVEEPTSYGIEVSGHVQVDDANRVRFNVDLRLSTNQVWQDLMVRVSLRPSIWEIRALAADQSLRFRMDDGQERVDKLFTAADLRQPDKLLKELGGPLLPSLLSSIGVSPQQQVGGPTGAAKAGGLTLGLHWEGRYDKLMVGGDWMRVMRMRARLFDRFEAVFFVSPVGEILKVELPDQIVLVNDALANLADPEDDRINTRH